MSQLLIYIKTAAIDHFANLPIMCSNFGCGIFLILNIYMAKYHEQRNKN